MTFDSADVQCAPGFYAHGRLLRAISLAELFNLELP